MTLRKVVTAIVGLSFLLAAPPTWAQKYGGILKSMVRGSSGSISLHEEASINVTWPMGSVYNNLVWFDPLKPIESMDTLMPELSERWQWNSDYTRLTFILRRGVHWQDGKPMVSGDVKHTFDVVRGATSERMKLNPRKNWYKNIKDIVTNGDYEVTFVLGRPQPALPMLLAAGYSPVYPSHVPFASLRTQPLGTGPFRMVEYKRDQFIKVRKNPDYFVKGRPYMDGIDFIIIRNKATRTAAMKSGQLDIAQVLETEQPVYKQLKAAVPSMKFQKRWIASYGSLVINNGRPPFNNKKLRQAVSLAIDRAKFVAAIHPGELPGGSVLPPPDGVWGLEKDELRTVPGFGDAEKSREQARAIMRELGYSTEHPLKVKLTCQSVAQWKNQAVWTIGELKQIYIDAELDVLETANWYGRMARRDFDMASNGTGAGADDPDVVYFEGFSCGSQRNYSNYCDPEAEKMFVQQSSTIDPKERKRLVHAIERKLITDVAWVPFSFRVNYYAHAARVMNFVGHQTNHNNGRMQEVWLAQ